MTLIWLVVWMIRKTPALKGEHVLGLNAWGLALGICCAWDLLG
jgi:hypothetical protein